MTILLVKAWRYTATTTAYATTPDRAGFFIGIMSDQSTGFGEVAPLPDMSPDTLAECETAFLACVHTLYAQPIPRTLQALWDLLDQCGPLPIALQHGLEMALMHLMAATLSTTVAEILNPDSRPVIHQHGLLFGDLQPMLDRYQKLAAAGYTCFKLKVGHLNEKAACKYVSAFFNVADKTHKVWLDVNRQWPLQLAISFCHAMADFPIYYIEEPIELSRELGRFHAHTGMYIGLDETLINQDSITIDFPYIAIIKPMCIGLRALHTLYQTKSKYRQGITISSAYESVISHYYYVQLAAALSNQSIGLGGCLSSQATTTWLYQNPVITLTDLPVVSQYHLGHGLAITRWDF